MTELEIESNRRDLILRPQEQVDELQRNLEDTIILRDFITDQEIDTLVSIYEKHLDKANTKTTGPTTVITRHFKEDPEFVEIFERISNKLELSLDIWGGNFFDTGKPFAIHNDVDYRHDIMPAKCMVIPLTKTYQTDYVYVTEEDAKFYVFDQTMPHGPVKCFKGEPDRFSPYNTPLSDYKHIIGLHADNRQPKLDVTFNRTWSEGLSVERECNWEPGDVIVFDCVRLHCSSDFTQHGMLRKLGLSLFTKHK